ncbi:hypothetical protein GCM10017781_18280 [Deinococcus metalli]|uniref:Uncharacterized protein n=1 Tax=Deinococcus metalli TaxID=1141878 RepID=A0ABQ3JPD0_9DEIO|nr:hypothetical protein GCM10017781_18280 [Deinococcus metalli]
MSARETVPVETPARAAMSRIVGEEGTLESALDTASSVGPVCGGVERPGAPGSTRVGTGAPVGGAF